MYRVGKMTNKNDARFSPQLKLSTHQQTIDFINGKKINPINIEISLTGICNANCPWCFYKGDRVKEELDYSVVEKLLYDMKDMGVKSVTWTGGGDPHLYTRIKDVVELTYKLGIQQGIITNATSKINFDPTLMEWVRVSQTPKDYNLESLKELRKCKTLGICVNYTGNDGVVHASLDVGEEIGVDYVQVRPALNCGGELTHIAPPDIEHELLLLTKYKFQDCAEPKGYDTCYGYNFCPFIWHTGEVNACAYMREQKPYVLGNIKESGLEEILSNAPESLPVREDCQICCKNDQTNIYINNIKNLKDVNFP